MIKFREIWTQKRGNCTQSVRVGRTIYVFFIPDQKKLTRRGMLSFVSTLTCMKLHGYNTIKSTLPLIPLSFASLPLLCTFGSPGIRVCVNSW